MCGAVYADLLAMARGTNSNHLGTKYPDSCWIDIECCHINASFYVGARGTDLPPLFFLTFCLQIYFQ
jgi:hypothetical protein